MSSQTSDAEFAPGQIVNSRNSDTACHRCKLCLHADLSGFSVGRECTVLAPVAVAGMLLTGPGVQEMELQETSSAIASLLLFLHEHQQGQEHLSEHCHQAQDDLVDAHGAEQANVRGSAVIAAQEKVMHM